MWKYVMREIRDAPLRSIYYILTIPMLVVGLISLLYGDFGRQQEKGSGVSVAPVVSQIPSTSQASPSPPSSLVAIESKNVTVPSGSDEKNEWLFVTFIKGFVAIVAFIITLGCLFYAVIIDVVLVLFGKNFPCVSAVWHLGWDVIFIGWYWDAPSAYSKFWLLPVQLMVLAGAGNAEK
ncbi:hypothetical protein [Phaeospirillum tilakii]|uniref:Uncharacterized protein n=1 Tax=Phaeospirillum tilakii TaxID=741673 RepID=A0ABW5CAP0_9PROT